MPNVRPRGLGGWPKELGVTTTTNPNPFVPVGLPAKQPWACLPDGTWKPAQLVYSYCGDPASGQRAYYAPTLGELWSLDPLGEPNALIIAFTIRGPVLGISEVIASNDDPSRPWWLARNGTSGALAWVEQTGPTTAEAGSVLWHAPTGEDEVAALAVNVVGAHRTLQLWTFDGSIWTATGPPTTTTAETLGAKPPVWDDRIYDVEMRDGLTMAAPLLWRFDADEYPGVGTTYTDPRGRTWNIGAGAITVQTDETGWQVIWADRARPPSAAAATWRLIGNQGVVDVTWIESRPLIAEAYRIYRPDGTQAGEVLAGTTAFTDTDPRPGVGKYRVYGVLEGVSGMFIDTNTLSLGQPLTGLSAVWNAAAGRVDLFGAVDLSSSTPNTRFTRPDGTMFAQGFFGPVAPPATWYDGNPVRGQVGQYMVDAMVNNRVGLRAWFPSVSIPPLPSQPQWLVSNGAGGAMAFGYWGPPAGCCTTGYEIETHENGVWTNRGISPGNGHNPGRFDWNATAAQVWARVRTIAAGGVSDWAQLGPVAPVYDVTGPGPSALSSWQPEGSYGRMVVRGTWPTDADTATGAIYYHDGIGNWTLAWGPSAITPGGGLAWATHVGQAGYGQTVIVRTWDHHGNQGADAAAGYTLTASPINLGAAAGSGHWLRNSSGGNGVWNPDGRQRPHQGYYTNAQRWTIGMWFYGADAIKNACAGKTITDIRVLVIRAGEGGNWVPGTVYVTGHYYGTNPGGVTQPSIWGSVAGAALNLNEMAWVSVGGDIMGHLISGALQGVGTWAPSGKPYIIFAGVNENGYSGALAIDHLG